MKKISFLIATLAIAVFSNSAFAAAVPYIGIYAGAVIADDSHLKDSIGDSAGVSMKTGYSFNGVLGIAIPVTAECNIRPEIEFGYKAADYDQFKYHGAQAKLNGDAHVLSGMANVYFDINTGTAVTPYIGGGIGIANVNVSNATGASGVLAWTKDDDTVFAYQGGVGAKFSVSKHIALDLGYRYFVADEATFGAIKSDFQAHNVQIGLQYQF